MEAVLTDTLGISRRMIQKLTRSRGVLLNRAPAFLAKKVRPGDVVAARTAAPEGADLLPVDMALQVLHEDADVVVVHKPPFVLVHPTAPEHRATLAHGVAFHFEQQGLNARVRPVHRIDRDTSGVVLIAKTAFAHQHLDRQLRERSLKREYIAFVEGVFAEEEGVIDAPIGKHKVHPHLRAVRPQAGEAALTRYHVAERYPAATQLRLELETGRTHQIRVHMAHVGHPILGDRHYGGRGLEMVNRQALHAARIHFSHPTSGELLQVSAPLPPDLVDLRDRLAGAL